MEDNVEDNVFDTEVKPTKRELKDAKELIKDLLPPGVMVPGVLFTRAAEKQGVSVYALKAAKYELGVGSVRVDEVWYWRCSKEWVNS